MTLMATRQTQASGEAMRWTRSQWSRAAQEHLVGCVLGDVGISASHEHDGDEHARGVRTYHGLEGFEPAGHAPPSHGLTKVLTPQPGEARRPCAQAGRELCPLVLLREADYIGCRQRVEEEQLSKVRRPRPSRPAGPRRPRRPRPLPGPPAGFAGRPASAAPPAAGPRPALRRLDPLHPFEAQLGHADLAHLHLADLAGHGHGKRLHDAHVPRDLLMRDAPLAEGSHRRRVQRHRRAPAASGSTPSAPPRSGRRAPR